MELIERSYYDILKEQADAHPEKDAIVMGDTRLTYGDLISKIDQTAWLLLNLGMKKGDKVVLWSTASPAWLYTYYGILRAGGIAVVLNANLPKGDAVPLSDFAEASFLLYGPSHDVKGTAEDAEQLSEAFHMEKEHVISINEVHLCAFPPVQPFETGVKDDAYIIYTSGTTSFPKAVLTSQFGIINTVASLIKAMSSAKGDRAVMAVPLFHAYGLMVSWVYLSTGGTILIPNRLAAEDAANLVEAEDASDLWSVAVIYQGIVDSKELTAKTAPRLHLCTIAGSYTTPVQFIRFETSLENAYFLNMYGMTETCAAYCLTRPEDSIKVRYTTVGRPIDGVEMRIWNEEQGFLPAGEIGEIVTRGYNLKNSYYKLPPEKQAVDADGWLHSGDLGTVDEQGNLRIVGRSKDIIIKGGENLAPAEIECEAVSCDCVQECRVFGYPDRVYGENIGACVTVRPGVTFNEAEVRSHIKKALGSYKTPVYFFVFDEFPLNANGKVDQRKLHTAMLIRLRRTELAGELEKGFTMLNTTFRNGTYCIDPIAAMVEEFSAILGFSAKKAMHIRLCAEEMLTLRINESNRDMQDVSMQIISYNDRLSLICTDAGMQPVNPDALDDKTRLSVAILSRFADDLAMSQRSDGQYQIVLQFAYDCDFSIQDFLMLHEEID